MISSLLYPKYKVIFILSFTALMLTITFLRSSEVVTFFDITMERVRADKWESFQDDQIYDVADKMPRPVGGQDGWEEYLSENMNYPLPALKAKVDGVVYVVFILETDGRTSNVEVLRGIGAGCDEEAKRLVEESPKWNPGSNNGEPVRVRMRIPVRFHLPG